MKKIIHGMIFKAMEEWAPLSLAYDWDKVGLQIGSRTDKTKKVMTTLDVNETVVDEAIEKDVNLIVAHHPLMFRPVQQIDFNSVKGRLIKKIIQHDLTVYAAHTNLDIAENGVNDLLSTALQLQQVEPLIETGDVAYVKLVVFVPTTHVNEVVDALSEVGAGHIGNYSHCTFQTSGTGTFMPLSGTNPFIGKHNKLEKVDEIKIETVVRETDIKQTIDAMKLAHPYEEVAYDVFPLKYVGKPYGLGRIGKLKTELTVNDLVKQVKEKYAVDTLRVIGNLQQKVNKVAIVGGSGESYFELAKVKGADVYITGDVTFHTAQDAKELGLAIIDPGHYIEEMMKEATKQYLERNFPDLPVITSTTDTNPFLYV